MWSQNTGSSLSRCSTGLREGGDTRSPRPRSRGSPTPQGRKQGQEVAQEDPAQPVPPAGEQRAQPHLSLGLFLLGGSQASPHHNPACPVPSASGEVIETSPYTHVSELGLQRGSIGSCGDLKEMGPGGGCWGPWGSFGMGLWGPPSLCVSLILVPDITTIHHTPDLELIRALCP